MTHKSAIINQPSMSKSSKSMPDVARPFAASPRHAFTIIELLIVIAIISLLMAIAFPAIAVMSRLTRGGAAETTIGIAVRTASAYAGKPKQTVSNSHPSGPPELTSNGAAILFTPNGDMRILQTDLHAFDSVSGNPMQSLAPTRFGYTDVPNRDYINLPNNAMVFGILRQGAFIRLITPPFAIHFDQFGQATTGFVAATDGRQMVYYDSNYDGKYNTNDPRPNTYDPEIWNSKAASWNATDRTKYDDAGLRPKLPFEVIETVVGVLTVQMQDFNLPRKSDGIPNSLVPDGTNWYLNDETTAWLLATDTVNNNGKLINAKPMFFSRNSGTILKEYR